jgi:hypothetical protein
MLHQSVTLVPPPPPQPKAHIQGNNGNITSTVTSLPISFGTPVAPGNTVTAYFGVNGAGNTGSITDDKGNVYTALPLDVLRSYAVSIAYCLNVTNGPTTLTLTTSLAGSYPFLIIDEFSGVTAYDTTAFNIYTGVAGSFPTGNITPASNGELLYTVGWSESSGPITVSSPFIFLQVGGSSNNVADGYYVQPTAAPIGATWNPPSSQSGVVRIVAFK